MERISGSIIILFVIALVGLVPSSDWRGEVRAQEPPDAAFSADTTSGEAPLTVNFSDESTGNIAEWMWDFGDGGTSMDQNPTHQYSDAGTYTVTLTVVDNDQQSDEEVKEDYIEVTPQEEGLDANFSASPLSGAPPLTVTFTDMSTGGAVRWEWDFDNNGVMDSTVRNPSYIYNQAGVYSVKLVVYDAANNSNIEVKNDYIRVEAAVTSDALIQITSLGSDITGFPASPGVPIVFTTQATSAGGETLYYKYWIVPDYCSPTYDTTTEMRDYSTDPTFTWTPTEEGNYVVTVWVTDEIEDVCPSVARLSFGVFLLGDLEVEVVDAVNAAPIAGASVEIGGLSATTDENGRATVADIASGTYTLAVSHPDYLTDEQEVNIIGNETVSFTVALTAGLAEGQTRIVLTWGETPRDLDSHLSGPDGEGGSFHVYFGNRAPAGAEANLDVDDVTSFGPETVTIEELHPGTYQYHVLDWSNGSGSDPSVDRNPQSTAMGQSGARVVVYSGNTTVASFQVPAGYGVNWHVFNIDGATGDIIPVNTLGGGTGPIGGAPDPVTFCDNNAGYCVSLLYAPDDDTKGLAWDGTNMWLCEGNHASSVIFKLNLTDEACRDFIESLGEVPPGAQCIDYLFSPGPNPQGLAYDGTYVWNLDQTDHVIYQIDPATKSVLGSVPTPTDDPEDFYTGLAWDGESFWVAGYKMAFNEETAEYEVSNPSLYQMDVITLAATATTSETMTSVVTQTVPLGEEYQRPLGLAYDGDNLWISTYNSSQIWKMDLETMQIAETGKPSPDNGTYGMTWDGLYLWVGSWYSPYILQLDPRFLPTFSEEGALRVNITNLSINAAALPLAVNSPITITANAIGQASPLFYRYFVSPGYCTADFGQWEELQAGYSQSNSVQWTPTAEDDYILRVFVTEDTSSSCQALGDLSIVVGNGGAGGGTAGSPGGTR